MELLDNLDNQYSLGQSILVQDILGLEISSLQTIHSYIFLYHNNIVMPIKIEKIIESNQNDIILISFYIKNYKAKSEY